MSDGTVEAVHALVEAVQRLLQQGLGLPMGRGVVSRRGEPLNMLRRLAGSFQAKQITACEKNQPEMFVAAPHSPIALRIQEQSVAAEHTELEMTKILGLNI